MNEKEYETFKRALADTMKWYPYRMLCAYGFRFAVNPHGWQPPNRERLLVNSSGQVAAWVWFEKDGMIQISPNGGYDKIVRLLGGNEDYALKIIRDGFRVFIATVYIA